MSEDAPSLREVFLKRAGRDRSLDPDDVMDILRDHLAAWPEAIEEILPGRRILGAPMDAKKRAKLMTAASIKSRQTKAKEIRDRAVPAIKAALEKNPELSLSQIGVLLDQLNIKPANSEHWSRGSVHRLMKMAGLIRE